MTEHQKREISEDIMKELRKDFPKYEEEMDFRIDERGDMRLTFRETTVVLTKEEYGIAKECDIQERKEILRPIICARMSNLVENYERETIRDSMDELKEEIRERLYHTSDEANIDINTLWLAFECVMGDLKNELKKEYQTKEN